jgi:fluoride ion exporter CrcB/FEX
MATIAAVAAGGSLGTLARYGLDVAIERRSFSLFGVALLNATASVGLGMLAVLVGERVGRLL